MNFRLSSILLFFIILSCKKELKKEVLDKRPEQIVLISKNAPQPYRHYINQDSLGATEIDNIGPYTTIQSPIFEYYSSQNTINKWQPKTNNLDTLVIPYHQEYLELSTRNSFTSLSNTFLIKNGDTVIFNYKNKIPRIELKNRTTNDFETNYNSYRLNKLFDNKYSSHYKIFLAVFFEENEDFDSTTIKYYQEALKENEKEKELLDSLLQTKTISKTDYNYRLDILTGLIEKHKSNETIKKWLNTYQKFDNEESIPVEIGFDLSKTDSLIKFQFFREHLNRISRYDLNFITEDNGNSGGSYIDSRIRFDSILADKRFTQSAKNFLLFDAYSEITMDFKLKDKEKYFEKLQENTTNRTQLEKLRKENNLNFEYSNILQLSSIKNEKITYSELISKNSGKWLYIDFWASWCAPCRQIMPESRKLKKELENKEVEFIYLSLNDIRENWEKAIIKDSIGNAQHYFIENGNTSKVIEDLGVETIPHYLIYNPDGKLINGYANRPGKGAKKQLEQLIKQ